MLLMIWSAALQSSLSVVFMKLVGELVQTSEFTNSGWLVFLSALMIFLFTASGVHMLNKAMKYYEQLEVQPTY